MKKFITFLLVAMIPLGISAQSWLYRAAEKHRQNSRRIVPRNNQQTRQDLQRYEQQERANQQRREARQREYKQEQERRRVNDEDSRTATIVQSNANNIPQSNDKVVSLVANGTGSTKEEATRNALRSAIEQAFGTFVSANTEVLNDDLIKDEIVTISAGSIKSYRELSSSQINGMYDVSVQATVSIDQLTKFAQSKGMRAELAGASFTMNMKMRELNKKNETAAIEHMIEKSKAIAQNGLFDYKLEIGEPKLMKNSKYAIKLKVLFTENANTRAFYENIYQTMQTLSLSRKEQQEYRNSGLDVYKYNAQLDELASGGYALRNQYPVFWRGNSFTRLLPIIVENALNYVIQDNLGNQITCMRRKIEATTNNYPLLDYIDKGNRACEWYYIDKYNQTLWFYELRPKDRIAREDRGYEKYPAIPLIDFGDYNNGIGTNVSFNPTVDNNGNEKRNNNPQKIYYYQEFFVIYSGEELSKLNSITINHR